MKNTSSFSTPVWLGEHVPSFLRQLSLEFDHDKLVSLSIGNNNQPGNSASTTTISQGQRIEQVIQAYFQGNGQSENLARQFEFEPRGTEFQKDVWNALLEIPYGEVRTYKQVAEQLGSSPRAVGNACRKNPIVILIPCHRVISVSGIGGYAGETGGDEIKIKRWLLQHEGVSI